MADSKKLGRSEVAPMRLWKPWTKVFFVIFVLSFAGLPQTQGKTAQMAATPAQEQSRPNEQADAPMRITLPAGTTISVRIADQVSSSHNHTGDLITGIVDPSVFIADHV